jgi:hypothetical protein
MTIITVIEKDQIKYNNHSYFPNHYRMIIAGDSGSGKTVLLSKLLLTNMLDWDILYLFTPSILQSSYQVLIEGINAGLLPAHIYGIYAEQNNINNWKTAITSIANTLKLQQTRKVIANSDPEKIMKPEDLASESMKVWKSLGINRSKKNLKPPKTIVVVDDAICKKQNAINEMFVYGRTYGINIIYLAQSFFATSKQAARTNTNVFILYRQSLDDTRRIYSRVCKEKKKFEDFYDEVNTYWKKPRGFVLITYSPTEPTKYIDGEQVQKSIEEIEHTLYN